MSQVMEDKSRTNLETELGRRLWLRKTKPECGCEWHRGESGDRDDAISCEVAKGLKPFA